MIAPPTSIAPSTSTPSSSTGGMTLEAIMAYLVCMDACLDTLNDELCQVNTHVGRIAQRQVVMGGYTMASSPEASEVRVMASAVLIMLRIMMMAR